MDPEVALHFRDELREARAVALKDAEAFEQIVLVLERIFTPRYVVEFLVDNTLGWIWYEMRQGQTTLKSRGSLLARWAI